MAVNDDTGKEDLRESPGFPQEIAWAVSALTYLTSDEQWPAFFKYMKDDNDAMADPTVTSEEIREVAIWAGHKLHTVGHSLAERQRAMRELPPFLRHMLGVEGFDPNEDDEDNASDEGTGNYL